MAFLPGELTADDLNEALGRHAYKAADETINNVGAVQNDNDLALAVDANGVYSLYLYVVYSSGTTPDFLCDFSAPSGTTFEASFFNYQPGTVAWAATGALGAVSGLAGTGANVPLIIRATVFVAATAGTLQWRWAQNTANASDTIVRKGSRLTLVKLNASN